MFPILLTGIFMATTNMADPLAEAQARFARTTSYRVTIQSNSPKGGRTEIHYAYRKPGWIRMDFITPHHGAVLIFSPDTGKIRLWPFGRQWPISMTLLPNDSLVTDPNGYRVDESDVGTLLRNIRQLQQGGKTAVHQDRFDGRAVSLLTVIGANGQALGNIHRYQVWLDQADYFPRKVISYGEDDQVLETVLMKNLQIDTPFPEDFWAP